MYFAFNKKVFFRSFQMSISMSILFISGHCNLTKNEFEQHYKPKLDLLQSTPIVIGNAFGADLMSFEYLLTKSYPIHLITIYHFGTGAPISFYKNTNVKLVEGFTSYTKRDEAMTVASTEDCAWVRPKSETKLLLGKHYSEKRKSGTELNLIRREKVREKIRQQNKSFET